MIDFLKLNKPSDILDIGCGDGQFIDEISKVLPDSRFYGIDISPFRVNRILSHVQMHGIENVIACLANAERIPFSREIFDLVIMRESLEHLNNPESAFSEASRVLKRGGHLLITTPVLHAYRFWKIASILPAFVKRLAKGEPIFKRNMDNAYDQPLSVRRLKRIIDGNRFITLSWRKVIFLPHESYLQFIPVPLLKTMIAISKVIRFLPFSSFAGLHHVIILRRR